MKLLIASDIHGSKYYTELLLRRFKEEQVDYMLLLGDYLYHGPRNPLTRDYNPSEVANLLNSVKCNIIAVRGNCDSEVDQMVLRFPMMGDYSQIVIDNYHFVLTHGHINNEKLSELETGTILLSGHTHVPLLKNEGGKVFLNPGSISLPKENHPNTYAIYANRTIQIKTLDGITYKKIDLESCVK